TLAGTRHQKIHRNGEVDALVEAALSELRGGNIGLGGKCTHGHAIAEQAGDVERHTPITGQVASGRGRHVYPALLAKIVIKGGVPGGDAIVPEREALIIGALLDPVGIKAKGPGSIHGAIEQLAAYAAEHALQQSHVAHSKSVASERMDRRQLQIGHRHVRCRHILAYIRPDARQVARRVIPELGEVVVNVRAYHARDPGVSAEAESSVRVSRELIKDKTVWPTDYLLETRGDAPG